MSTPHPTPHRLPWHQATAQALTYGTLSAAVILGPFYLSALILNPAS